MELEFVKINPAGNMTVIILTPLPRSTYADVARLIMAPGSLGAEQVGFSEVAERPGSMGRLHMMGGEFCGNASRAFGAFLALHSQTEQIPIEVSGHCGVLEIEVKFGPDGRPSWASSPVPLPKSVRTLPGFGGSARLIEFAGISHAVIWGETPSEGAYRRIAETHFADDCAAFGVMFVEGEADDALEAAGGEVQMVPIVGVRDSRSLVWEGSCASGSVAVACAVAHLRGGKMGDLKVKQPGGTLIARLEWSDGITGAEIGGPVLVVARGTVWLENSNTEGTRDEDNRNSRGHGLALEP